VQAQPAPGSARRAATLPAMTSAPAAAPAPAARGGGPGPACSDVREDPQPYALSVGKTTRYRPSSAVVRMVLDDQTSESGVPGAISPSAPAGMAAPTGGSSTVVGLTARAPTNSQSVGSRPGVGDIAVRLLSPTDIYLTGKRIGAANVVMVHAGGSCTLLNVVVGMDACARC
jgi:pilus assembly protein CpaC